MVSADLPLDVVSLDSRSVDRVYERALSITIKMSYEHERLTNTSLSQHNGFVDHVSGVYRRKNKKEKFIEGDVCFCWTKNGCRIAEE